jgi:aspartyl-tRNA synthetase
MRDSYVLLRLYSLNDITTILKSDFPSSLPCSLAIMADLVQEETPVFSVLSVPGKGSATVNLPDPVKKALAAAALSETAPAPAKAAVSESAPAPAAKKAAAASSPAPKESKKDKKAKKNAAAATGGDAGKKAAPPPAAGGKQLTKKELRILEKQKKAEADKAAALAADNAAMDPSKFGDLPLIQSTEMTDRTFIKVCDLAKQPLNTPVWIRARIDHSRAQSKMAFLGIRQGISVIQAVLAENKDVPKLMVKYAAGLPKESVVDICGVLTAAEVKSDKITVGTIELQIQKFFCVSKAGPELPFQLADASNPNLDDTVSDKEDDKKSLTVSLDTLLDSRWISLRTTTNQSIFRIKMGVAQLFREFLQKHDFVEVQTPKLIGGASESGSSVFKLDYFGQNACLAQSPQLYKQMLCACSGFERVYEIGPVFRAENSNTARHLCEFNGLDFEMCFYEHYYEVLDMMSNLFIYIFDNLNARYGKEIEAVRKQFPSKPLRYLRPTLRLEFAEAVKMLQDAGYDQGDYDDLSTENEKALGRMVADKYETDFFMLDKYPLDVRPFYTMPCPDNPKLSNSYDFFIRGQEILSGAQRVHDVELLTSRLKEFGMSAEDDASIKGYVDSFRHGAEPHGGGGIGLERVVMLFLDLQNIRHVCTFPRDPKRLGP